MRFVRKACDNKGCKCLSWPCSPIVTLALRFDLQCKEYKHDGTQTTFRQCKSWKAVEIDCHSFYHSLIFETMCLTVFQTTIACQNDPKWSTTMTKAKTQAQPRKQNSSLQFSSTKVTTSAIGVSRPCIQNQYFNSTKSPSDPVRHWHLDQPWAESSRKCFMFQWSSTTILWESFYGLFFGESYSDIQFPWC